jgi:chromate transporter
MPHLLEVAKLFTKLGFTAFGGPAVHTGLMEDEVVHRRKWIDRQHFLDLVSAVNFIPGPNSTELAIHLGYVRAGWRGLIVAGVCFIVPAVLIILPLAWMYVTFSQMPAVTGVMRAVNAVVIAVIAVAMVRLMKTALNTPLYIAVAVVTVAVGLGWEWMALRRPEMRSVPMELLLLLFGGVAGAISRRRQSVTLPAVAPGLLVMVLEFLRIGATLFGSGYVLVAFLQAAFVDRTGLLTQQQMQDSIAIGQITPGPLLTTATFAGYVIGTKTLGGGPAFGALAGILATAAIFLPSFLFVALLGRFIAKLRSAPAARGALDGMNAAVVAMIFLVLIKLAMTNLRDAWSISLAVLGGVAMLVWNLNPTWLILTAAAIGAIVFR